MGDDRDAREQRHFQAGLAHYRAGRPAEALRAFEAAKRLAPGSVEARLWAAEARRRLGDDGAALSELEAAARLDPDDAEPLLCMAGVCRERGDTEAEWRLVRAAARVPVNSASRQQALGYLAFREGDHQKALDHFYYGNELHQDNDRSLPAIGQTLLHLGRDAEARKVLVRAAALPDASADTVYHLGVSEQRLGNYEAARRAYRAALEADFRYRDAYLALLQIEVSSRRWGRVLGLVLWMLGRVWKERRRVR